MSFTRGCKSDCSVAIWIQYSFPPSLDLFIYPPLDRSLSSIQSHSRIVSIQCIYFSTIRFNILVEVRDGFKVQLGAHNNTSSSDISRVLFFKFNKSAKPIPLGVQLMLIYPLSLLIRLVVKILTPAKVPPTQRDILFLLTLIVSLFIVYFDYCTCSVRLYPLCMCQCW